MRWSSLFAILLATSCVTPTYPEPKPEVTRVSDVGMPIVTHKAPDDTSVLGKLVTQDRVLTVVTSDDGPRFWVSTREGRVLSHDLSSEELDSRHRDLADVYRVGTARPYLDASVDGALMSTTED